MRLRNLPWPRVTGLRSSTIAPTYHDDIVTLVGHRYIHHEALAAPPRSSHSACLLFIIFSPFTPSSQPTGDTYFEKTGRWSPCVFMVLGRREFLPFILTSSNDIIPPQPFLTMEGSTHECHSSQPLVLESLLAVQAHLRRPQPSTTICDRSVTLNRNTFLASVRQDKTRDVPTC